MKSKLEESKMILNEKIKENEIKLESMKIQILKESKQLHDSLNDKLMMLQGIIIILH